MIAKRVRSAAALALDGDRLDLSLADERPQGGIDRGDLAERVAVDGGPNLAEAHWFGLSDLPPAAEVAHHGWALDVIGKVLV